MSRSGENRKLKNGAHFHWISFKSNKEDKRIANRTMRRVNKVRLKVLTDNELHLPLGPDLYHTPREVRDNWNFNSDGGCSYINFLQNKYISRSNEVIEWTKEDIRKINSK